MSNLKISAMTPDAAREILSWQYEGDYAIYNAAPANVEEEIAYFCVPENHYFAIYDGDDLVGHCCFQHEARVKGGDYSQEALDIGAGMRPEWTGQGKGASLIAAIMNFGIERYQPKVLRATIAAWNERAQKATVKNGFQEESRFIAEHSGKEFLIYVKNNLSKSV